MTAYDFDRQDIFDGSTDRELPVQLPVGAINLLTQVRQSMTDIEELAESIRIKGQMTQGFAVALTQRQAAKYLREINEIRQTTYTTKDLTAVTIDSERYFVVLVAGHRRYLAVQHLVRSKARMTKKYNGLYRCILRFGMSAGAALEIQFQENRHKQVPVNEEAAYAWDFYKWQKKSNPGLTLASFGRTIGRSADWVRRAVRFCSLPDSLQQYAGGGDVVIPYGILAEAARLAEGLKKAGRPIDESSLTKMVVDTVIKKTTVANFTKMVSSRLEHARGGQETLFGEMPKQSRPTRQVVAPELARSSYALLSYLKQLEALQRAGALQGDFLGPEMDPGVLQGYSLGSPIKLSAEVAAQLRQMLPHFEQLAAKSGGRHRPALEEGQGPVEKAAGLLSGLAAVEAGE